MKVVEGKIVYTLIWILGFTLGIVGFFFGLVVGLYLGG